MAAFRGGAKNERLYNVKAANSSDFAARSYSYQGPLQMWIFEGQLQTVKSLDSIYIFTSYLYSLKTFHKDKNDIQSLAALLYHVTTLRMVPILQRFTI